MTKAKNTDKGPVAKWQPQGRIYCGRGWVIDRVGESNDGGRGQIYLNNDEKILKNKYNKKERYKIYMRYTKVLLTNKEYSLF